MRATNSRHAAGVTISSLVQALDEIAGLLKFNRNKVSCGSVDALDFRARRLRRAVIDVVGPEIPAALIRLAIEEVVIVLAHKEARIIDQVRRWASRSIGDSHSCRRGCYQPGAASRIRQAHRKSFGALNI